MVVCFIDEVVAEGVLNKDVATADVPEKRLRRALSTWTGDEKRSCAETAGELGTAKIYEQRTNVLYFKK